MDTEDYKAKDYHRMVWDAANKETNSYFRSDIRSWVGGIIGSLVSAIATSYALDFWSGATGTPITIQVIITLVSLPLGFAAFVIGLYLWTGVWYIPPKLYRKKEIEANKFTWNDVLIEIPEMPKDDPLPTCLIITNKKICDIEKANVKVVLIKKGRILAESHRLPLNLGWGDDGSGTWGDITLEKNGEGKVVIVANWLLENRGVFLLATNSDNLIKGRADFIELEIDTPYTIQLKWSGEVEGRAMDEYVKTYSLKYDQEKIYFKEVSYT